MPVFTPKWSSFPNFATQNTKRTTIYGGVIMRTEIENTTFCGLLSLNHRNSLKD